MKQLVLALSAKLVAMMFTPSATFADSLQRTRYLLLGDRIVESTNNAKLTGGTVRDSLLDAVANELVVAKPITETMADGQL